MPERAATTPESPSGTAATRWVDARGPVPGAGPVDRPALGWTELVVAIAAYLALTVVVALLFTGPDQDTTAVIAITELVTVAAVAIALAVRVRSLGALGLRRTSARRLLVGVAAGVGGLLVNRLVVIAYILASGDESNPQQAMADSAAASGWSLLALLLAGAVLAPIAEELLFRGVVYGSLRRYGRVVATVASALVFGLAHGLNVVLPAAVVLGVLTALLYERTRSIWPGVVAHGVNNAILFVLAAILLG
jgi:membrane protease YdiL (CAAX protease family)